ncbi:MAG: arginase family protein, partial [Blastocatellales bacterium]
GGPTYRESHLAMEKIADSGKMLSFELTEVNPVLDVANRTAELGVQLILSAFGKKIMCAPRALRRKIVEKTESRSNFRRAFRRT